MKFRVLIAILSACFGLHLSETRAQQLNSEVLEKLVGTFEAATRPSGILMGAQLAVGTVRDPRLIRHAYGRVSPESTEPVNERTLFCIGSCSNGLKSVLRATHSRSIRQILRPVTLSG